jgi:hypothetical protein
MLLIVDADAIVDPWLSQHSTKAVLKNGAGISKDLAARRTQW